MLNIKNIDKLKNKDVRDIIDDISELFFFTDGTPIFRLSSETGELNSNDAILKNIRHLDKYYVYFYYHKWLSHNNWEPYITMYVTNIEKTKLYCINTEGFIGEFDAFHGSSVFKLKESESQDYVYYSVRNEHIIDNSDEYRIANSMDVRYSINANFDGITISATTGGLNVYNSDRSEPKFESKNFLYVFDDKLANPYVYNEAKKISIFDDSQEVLRFNSDSNSYVFKECHDKAVMIYPKNKKYEPMIFRCVAKLGNRLLGYINRSSNEEHCVLCEMTIQETEGTQSIGVRVFNTLGPVSSYGRYYNTALAKVNIYAFEVAFPEEYERMYGKYRTLYVVLPDESHKDSITDDTLVIYEYNSCDKESDANVVTTDTLDRPMYISLEPVFTYNTKTNKLKSVQVFDHKKYKIDIFESKKEEN